jgi:glycosyltransferase involved in cell wall biosynthesis
MDELTVGFFTDSYFPEIDGVTYTLRLWKERLEERGHEVYIIYPGSKRYDPEENEIPVRSLPNPLYRGYKIGMPLGYGKLPELDVVHCHGPAFVGRYGRRYAAKEGIPKVYTHHTPIEEYVEQAIRSKRVADIIGRIYVPIENRFLSKFDVVTASTGRMDRDVEAKKLTVGIDTEFFRPKDTSFVDDMGLDRPVVGYSGRVSREKNIDHLCRFAEGFEGTVVIVGEGPDRPRIQAMAGENVEVMDFLERERLPEFYSGIDVFATASTGDTLGLSTLEANACGTPVVAADVEPFNRTIKSENGERFEFGDTGDMLRAVKKALSKDYRTRTAAEEHRIEDTIEMLESIYRKETVGQVEEKYPKAPAAAE